MTLDLHNSRSCLKHARRRIVELEADIKEYYSTAPYTETNDIDPTTGDRVRKVQVTKQPGRELGHVAFDAISHMRAALDQAAHAVAVASGSKEKSAYFPFGSTEEEIREKRCGGSKAFPKKLFDLMISFQPYKTGDFNLWALNKLCNTMKHAVMVYPALRPSAVTIHSGAISGGTVGHKWSSEISELELERIRPDGSSSLVITYKFQIQLGDESRVAGLPPAVEYLNYVANLIENILIAIEATQIPT